MSPVYSQPNYSEHSPHSFTLSPGIVFFLVVIVLLAIVLICSIAYYIHIRRNKNLQVEFFRPPPMAKAICTEHDLEHDLKHDSTSVGNLLCSLDDRLRDITLISIQAGMSSVWRRTNKDIRGDTTLSTETSISYNDSLFPHHTLVSSIPSVSSIVSQTFEKLEDSDTTYEVQRAQNGSVEVKESVLFMWRNSTPVLDKKMSTPSVIVSEIPVLPSFSTSMSTNGHFLQMPYLIVTIPSTNSIFSTTSSVSVDLDEFPTPPQDFKQISASTCVPEDRKAKRMTIEHTMSFRAVQ